MRTMRLVSAAALVLAATAVMAAKPDTDEPKGGPERAENVRKACIEISLTGQVGPNVGDERCDGTARVWFDIDRKQYRINIVMIVTTGLGKERIPQNEANVVLTGDAGAAWEVKDGKIDDVEQQQVKSVESGEPITENAHEVGAVMIPFIDAAFGYKRLKTEAVMEPAETPLGDKDDLRWVRIRAPEKHDHGLAGKVALFNAESSAWLGLSPTTNWPMKYVVRGKRTESLTFTITKIDTKPDLKGVFDVPAEVKAKLEKK